MKADYEVACDVRYPAAPVKAFSDRNGDLVTYLIVLQDASGVTHVLHRGSVELNVPQCTPADLG